MQLLGEIDCLIFDKTGTLTLAEPILVNIHALGGRNENDVLLLAATAEHRQTHPIALSILTEACKRQLDLYTTDDMHYEIGYGIKVMINGRKVLVGSYRFMMIEAIEIPDTIYPVIEHCQNMGISLVFVAEDGEMAGLLEMDACLRPEAKEIVNWLKLSGIELFIVSGDQDAPTRKLSDELGMDGYFANVLPDGKANIVNKLKASGKKVGFIGDGINDAIALRAADVSVSFRSATHAASDNAQIVLMNDNLEQLRLLFNLAKTFNKSVSLNYRQSIIMSLSAACAAIFLPHKFLVVQTFFVIELIIGSIIATRPLLDEKTQSGEVQRLLEHKP